MSWKFPEQRIKSGSVVEIDDLNRVLTEVAEELDGGLNEHNWEKDSFSRHDCDDDVAMEVWQTKQAQNETTNPALYAEEFSRVRAHQGWFPIKSASHAASITATTQKSTLWILASFQHRQASESAAVVQYALRVDGTVIPETVTGASSSLNDAYHQPAEGTFVSVIHGSGINQRRRSVSLDTLVPVAPGTHTVDLVARMVSKTTANEAYFWVGSRELILLSMRK